MPKQVFPKKLNLACIISSERSSEFEELESMLNKGKCVLSHKNQGVQAPRSYCYKLYTQKSRSSVH